MSAPELLERIRVVLVRTSHPGNIGAAARAMLTMNLHALTLVAPRSFPHAEAKAMATGASALLAQARVVASLDEALQGACFVVGVTARRRDLAADMLDCRRAAPIILGEALAHDVALIFGPEIYGLSNAELDRCQLLLTIPANPEFGSLNLAQAVQVVAYELHSALGVDRPAPEIEADWASHEELEGLFEHFERTLYRIEFLDPFEPTRLMRRLRRLFSRTRLEREEINILRGILKQVNRVADKTP